MYKFCCQLYWFSDKQNVVFLLLLRATCIIIDSKKFFGFWFLVFVFRIFYPRRLSFPRLFSQYRVPKLSVIFRRLCGLSSQYFGRINPFSYYDLHPRKHQSELPPGNRTPTPQETLEPSGFEPGCPLYNPSLNPSTPSPQLTCCLNRIFSL